MKIELGGQSNDWASPKAHLIERLRRSAVLGGVWQVQLLFTRHGVTIVIRN